MECDADYIENIDDDSAKFDYSYIDHDNDLEMDYGSSSETIYELWEFCIRPTLADGISASKFVLSLCFIFRLTYLFVQGKISLVWCHLALGMAGSFALYHFFGLNMVFVIFLALIGIAAITFARITIPEYQGGFCAAVCVFFLVSCELFFVERKQWHQIRGSQMILSMKLISFSYDTKLGSRLKPSIVETFGYLFCVGNVIFGPWVDYNAYISFCNNSTLRISWILPIMKSLFLSFLFLTLSTCFTSWILSDNMLMWLVVYRDALAFRSSHYFVCYLAEATSLIIGISSSFSQGTSPIHVELPRSLVEVVIFWNIPMHRWLKIYVFKKAKHYGTFIAIISTYVASSVLHGLNFQLAAVLLSLGFYTYIEFVLRNKLASAFDACIAARRCMKECNHKNKASDPYVFATNMAFGFVSVFHLAYLGVMFDSSSTLQEEGYSMQHTLSKWSDLSFASHWIAVATFFFSAII